MPDTILTLAGIVFQDFEIPQSINFGGQQRLVVHKMIGGARQVDALGSDQDDIQWEGRFRTGTALDRAQQIDRLRIIGQPVTLSMGGITVQVVISAFKWDYQRAYEIPYRITCTPSQAEVAPATASQGTDFLVGLDTGGAGGLLSGVQSSLSGLSDLAAPLAAVSTALSGATGQIASLGTLVGASGAQTAGIVSSITTAQSGMQGLLSLTDGHVIQAAQALSTVGNPTGAVSALSMQVNALSSLSSLVTARGLLGRAAVNL